MKKYLFIGGTYGVSVYTQRNCIKKYSLVHNIPQLMANSKELPLIIMDDAFDIYGSALNPLIFQANELGFVITFLNYEDDFPFSEDENENVRDLIEGFGQGDDDE